MLTTKALRTRQHLIEAAYAVLLEGGVESLTLDRVAARASVSKGALTYHFRSKRDLHKALIESYIAHMNEEMDKYTSAFEGAEPDCLLAGYIEWFKGFERNNRGWAQVGLVLLSYFVHDDEMMAPVKEWYRALFARIEALPSQRRNSALLCIMAMEGFFYAHKFGLDYISARSKRALWPYMLDEVGDVHVKRVKTHVDY